MRDKFIVYFLLNTFVLLSCVVLNQGPLYYYDTIGYARSGALVVLPTLNWLAGSNIVEPYWIGLVAPADRSPVYGVFVYITQYLGMTGLIAIAQAAVAAWLITLTVYVVMPRRFGPLSLALSVLLTLVTPLAIFAALLTPDIWSGISIVAFALAISCWASFHVATRWGLVAIIGFSVAFHPSHILIVLTLLAVCVLMLIWKSVAKALSKTALMAIAAGVLLGAASPYIGYSVIRGYTGADTHRLPFLSAHLNDKGPGVEYLQTQCDVVDFAMCAYPQYFDTHWVTFMFGLNLPPEDFKRMAEQDVAFATEVLKAYPAKTVGFFVKQGFTQFVTMDTNDLILRDVHKKFLARISPEERAAVQRGYFYARPGAIVAVEIIAWGAVVVSLAFGIFLIRQRAWSGAPPELLWFLGLCLFGFVINSLICGALASPYGRFQLRTVWLLPFITSLSMMLWYQKVKDGDQHKA